MGTIYHQWPKIDLHRHLEGSLRMETIYELSRKLRLPFPYHDNNLFRSMFAFDNNDERTLKKFISKFINIRKLIRDREILARITYESLADAALDNVVYVELRFNYMAMINGGLSPREIIGGINEGIRIAKNDFEIETGLICGISRDMNIECAEETVNFAISNIDNGIIAIDLMNDESFSPELFQAPFERARRAGLYATAHAGEAGDAGNIIKCINLLGAQRIGHGTQILKNAESLSAAREHNILVECCLTSNMQTGAIETLSDHPLPALLDCKIPVCINTDDPGVSSINLSHEYALANSELKIGDESLVNMLFNTVDHIFRSDYKSVLYEKLNNYFCPYDRE
jgi:adenosine deaminase